MSIAPPARVVHVDSEQGFSGGEVQVFLLMEGLRALGSEQLLVAPPGSAAADAGRRRGFAVREVPMRNVLDLPAVLRLARILREATLGHLHTGRAAWLGGLAAALSGRPVVITRRMDRRVRRGPGTHLAYNCFARRVLAISPAVKECLLAGGVRGDRIEVVWEALDPARIAAPSGRDATRAALGLLPAQFAVLVLARLQHRKGIDVLIEAVANLADPNLVLLVAGEGPEQAALGELAAARGLGQSVRFLGPRGDAGDLLLACDLFVLPSRAEGLGNAAMEALGAGRPVVASRVGGLAEMVVDGRCGLLVPPGDAGALAAAIARMRDDPELRARLGRAGPARLDEGFRPERMIQEHLRIYREILAKAPQGATVAPR